MKKFLSVILIAVMMLSLAACSSSNEETTTKAPETTTQAPEATTQAPEATTPAPEQTTEATTEEVTEEVTTEATTEEITTEEPKEEVTTAPEATKGQSPLDVLVMAWGAHTDDQKFAIMGGDYNTMVMDAPGAFGVEDAEALDALLALPADQAGNIDAAASIIHMMNANTFTCGAFSIAEGADAAAVAQALHDNIAARQWMCGFPDKMVIMTIDNVVVSMFGNETAIDNFKGHVEANYAGAVVNFDEAIA